jgi:hypothetical protein
MRTYLIPFYPVAPSDAQANRQAFKDALDEISDKQVQDTIDRLVVALAKHFLESGHIKQDHIALEHAAEVVASCVWQKVAAPDAKAASG